MSSRRDLRPLLLLFVGPLLQNAVLMTWLNLMTFKASAAGYKPNELCYIGIIAAFGYTVSSWLAGRWVSSKNALWVVAAATVCSAAVGLAIVWLPPFAPYLGIGVALGVVNGNYFCPFQVGMGSVKPFKTLAWTIAFYNVSWGTGVAIGPYLAGVLEGMPKGADGLPPKWPFMALAGGLALVHTILVLLALAAPKSDPALARGAEPLIPSTPRLRRLGYLCSLVGQFVVASLTMSLWPPLAETQGLSAYEKGLALAALGIQIPVGGIVFATQRHRLRRPWMLIALLLLVAGCYQALPLVTVWPWHLALFSVLGFACSGLFFHGVYYPNADPDTPHRSVAVMETVVGVAGFTGPLLMGNLAGGSAVSDWWPYLAGSALILGVAVLALRIWLSGDTTAEAAEPNPAPAAK